MNHPNMNKQFQLQVPTRLVFGSPLDSTIGRQVRTLGERVLVLHGIDSSASHGYLNVLLSALESSGCKPTACGGIEPNPRIHHAVEVGRLIKEQRIEVVVGLGGGSVIDIARLSSLAATIGAQDVETLWEYRVAGAKGISHIPPLRVAVVAIPTCGGSGSEMSPAALAVHGVTKEVFYSPNLFPVIAFVDPSLAVTLSSPQTFYMAVDALVQCVEGATSSNRNPFSMSLAAQGIRIVLKYLPLALDSPTNSEYRTWLAIAGILSFYTINMSGVGAIHALSDPLSARFDWPHGAALALLAPIIWRSNLGANINTIYSHLAHLLTDTSTSHELSDHEAATSLIETLTNFLSAHWVKANCEVPVPSDWPLAQMVSEAQSPDLAANPIPVTEGEIAKWYQTLSQQVGQD